MLENRLEQWQELPYFDTSFQFKWQPVSKGIRFDQLSLSQKQIIKHFEFHNEISTKDKLFYNFFAYSQKKKIKVFDYLPLTFILNVGTFTESLDYERFMN